MKIVIDISDDYYKVLMNIPDWQCGADTLLIKNGTPLSKVIEDIKAEIADIYCGAYCDNPYTAGKVREQALDIIDKHITKT